jgi:hypothetical protein
MNRYTRVDRTWEFLAQKKHSNEHFTLKELQQATGYSLVSIKTYLSKYWRGHLAATAQGYLVIGFSGFDRHQYRNYMTQNRT